MHYHRAALRELAGCDASRNMPPSILPSTTTSTCDDPSVHGTISSSTAPLHLPSGVSSGRPNSLVFGGITQTCDFTLTVPQILLVWLESWPLLASRACSFLQFGSLLDLFFSRQGPCRTNRRWVGKVHSFLGHSTVTPASNARLWVPVLDRRTPWLYQPRAPSLD